MRGKLDKHAQVSRKKVMKDLLRDTKLNEKIWNSTKEVTVIEESLRAREGASRQWSEMTMFLVCHADWSNDRRGFIPFRTIQQLDRIPLGTNRDKSA